MSSSFSSPPTEYPLTHIPPDRFRTSGYSSQLQGQNGNDTSYNSRGETHTPLFGSDGSARDSRNNGHVPADTRDKARFNRHLDDWWLWEMLSILVSLLSLIAVVVILKSYSGRPLPDWPESITLNALIAVITTIMTAAMMVSVPACISQLKWLWFREPRPVKDFDTFDAASRGPWGSFLLLFRLRAVPGLVTGGAIITILALGIAPFMQQIVSFPLTNVVFHDGHASAPRALSYDEGEDIHQIGGGLATGPSLETKAAIYRGLFTSPVVPLSPTCSTGNCTFPVFDSLAFCSTCKNVTGDVKRTYTKAKTRGGELFGWNLNLTYSLPGDVELKVPVIYEDEELTDLIYGSSMVSRTNVSATMSKDVLGISNPMLTLAILQFLWIDDEGYGANYLESMPMALECALYFCVQSYNTTVVNNNATTEIVSTWYNGTAPVQTLGYNGNSTLRPPKSDQPLDTSAPGGNNFTIPADTFETTLWYLNKTLSGTALSRYSEVNQGNDGVNDVLEAMNGHKNISSLMENLATAYTDRIREMYDGDYKAVSGDTMVQVPHVRVKWAWLTFPAALVAFSILLLLFTIIATVKARVPVWKDSSLAVLFHGLSGHETLTKPLGGLDKKSSMKESGKYQVIALGKDNGDNWRLLI